jgi:chaperonin cofactor prefoldin
VQQPAKAPRAPTPAPYIVNPQTAQLSAQEVEGLRVKLDDLREELQDAASRRRTVSEQLRSTDDSRVRTGLEERLSVLDARIVSLEKDITATGEQLRSAPPALLAETRQPGAREASQIANRVVDEIVPIVAIISVFVFAPFAIAISRFIWRRSTPAARASVPDHATEQRLDQIQQSIDTIAIEVERISEGQRFVTKLLSEKDRAALGAGAAEPIRASQKSAVPSERG